DESDNSIFLPSRRPRLLGQRCRAALPTRAAPVLIQTEWESDEAFLESPTLTWHRWSFQSEFRARHRWSFSRVPAPAGPQDQATGQSDNGAQNMRTKYGLVVLAPALLTSGCLGGDTGTGILVAISTDLSRPDQIDSAGIEVDDPKGALDLI